MLSILNSLTVKGNSKLQVFFGDEIEGSILKEEFDIFPSRIREVLLNTLIIKGMADGYINFTFTSSEDANHVLEIVSNYQKNKVRSETRKNNMHILSAGMYEKEDIDLLYEAQKGLCYYTGVPFSERNGKYSIDHVIPVSEGGSSWPSNLVLATVEINNEKKNQSKRKFFAIIGKRNSDDWLQEQKVFCKKVDAKRRVIDRKRRESVSKKLCDITERLCVLFPEVDVEYRLNRDDVELFVDYTLIDFPPGFIRQPKKSFSVDYISGIISAVLSK